MEYILGLYLLIMPVIFQHILADLPVVSLDQLCAQVSKMDCDTEYVSHDDTQTCGMDGVTYDNFCEYAKARCSNVNIGIANIGSCVAADPSSTPPPDHIVAIHADIIVQFFCNNADTIDCLLEGNDAYCGNNGILYQNECTFAKAKCTVPSLTNQSLQFCADGSETVGK